MSGASPSGFHRPGFLLLAVARHFPVLIGGSRDLSDDPRARFGTRTHARPQPTRSRFRSPRQAQGTCPCAQSRRPRSRGLARGSKTPGEPEPALLLRARTPRQRRRGRGRQAHVGVGEKGEGSSSGLGGWRVPHGGYRHRSRLARPRARRRSGTASRAPFGANAKDVQSAARQGRSDTGREAVQELGRRVRASPSRRRQTFGARIPRAARGVGQAAGAARPPGLRAADVASRGRAHVRDVLVGPVEHDQDRRSARLGRDHGRRDGVRVRDRPRHPARARRAQPCDEHGPRRELRDGNERPRATGNRRHLPDQPGGVGRRSRNGARQHHVGVVGLRRRGGIGWDCVAVRPQRPELDRLRGVRRPRARARPDSTPRRRRGQTRAVARRHQHFVGRNPGTDQPHQRVRRRSRRRVPKR